MIALSSPLTRSARSIAASSSSSGETSPRRTSSACAVASRVARSLVSAMVERYGPPAAGVQQRTTLVLDAWRSGIDPAAHAFGGGRERVHGVEHAPRARAAGLGRGVVPRHGAHDTVVVGRRRRVGLVPAERAVRAYRLGAPARRHP